MIGAKLYQNRSRVRLFLALYALLALIGIVLGGLSVSRNQPLSGVEGFTVIFGAGMAFMTWSKSKKPRIVVGEEHLELRQQRNPVFLKYKTIHSITRMKDSRMVIGVRDGHGLKQVSVWLKDVESGEAEKLVDFCLKKGWKAR